MRKRTTRAGRAAVARAKYAASKRSRKHPVRTAKRPVRRTGVPAAAGRRATIRVYRHGLGDCILVRLKRSNRSDFTILIDCGVAVATQDAANKMKRVLEDVVQMTKGRIDVLAVTHEHWDHVSGFSQAKDVLARLEVGEVWVAWTEDETDELAKSLRKDHDQAVAAVAASAQAVAMAGRPGSGAGTSRRAGTSWCGGRENQGGARYREGEGAERAEAALLAADRPSVSGARHGYPHLRARAAARLGAHSQNPAVEEPSRDLRACARRQGHISARRQVRARFPRRGCAFCRSMDDLIGAGARRSILPDPLLEPSWGERRWAAN